MLTFNSGKSADYGLNIVDIERDFMPPVRNDYIEIDGMDGVYYTGSTFDKKEIKVDVNITAIDENDLRVKARAIGRWLHTDVEVPFSFEDEPDLIYVGKVDSNSLKETLRFGEGTITFICSKPTATGLHHTINAGTSVNINVQGSAKTYPSFTVNFTGSVTNWQVTNADGKYLKINTNFVAGDTLIINGDTGKVTINGQLSMQALDLHSQYFALMPGNNSLTLQTGAQIDYDDKWK